jgi:hypothetical protein
MAKLSEIRLGLATVIPWSLVLILGTFQIANVTHRALPETPAVDVNTGESDSQETVDKEETVANKLDKVRQEFAKIEDESDKVLIYKLLSGASEYLKNSKHLESTSQFDPILGRVQSSYGWAREKYPEFTTAVSEYLVAAGYDKPRKLETQEDRDWFQSIFSSLAGAIR